MALYKLDHYYYYYYQELLFGNPGPPRKSSSFPEVHVKMRFDRITTYFQRYCHSKITLFFVIKTPKRHILGRIRVV